MFYHDDVEGHRVIGEAALNLLSRMQDVNVANLIAELSAMSEQEECDEKLSLISDARCWLKNHTSTGKRYPRAKSWLDTPVPPPLSAVDNSSAAETE